MDMQDPKAIGHLIFHKFSGSLILNINIKIKKLKKSLLVCI